MEIVRLPSFAYDSLSGITIMCCISVFENNIYFVQFSIVDYSGRVSLVLLILVLDISFKDFFF